MGVEGPPSHAKVLPTRFVVDKDDAGKRLDQVLAAHIPGLSRRRARLLLDIGGVFVDGARTKVAGRLVRPGQKVLAHMGSVLDRATNAVGPAARASDEAKLPPPRVVYADDAIVVVEKPSGLLTAPTPESDRNNLASMLARMLASPVHVVHRLDMETSGLLVFARNEDANRSLGAIFREHDIDREYIAVLHGKLERDEQVCDAPIAGRTASTKVVVRRRWERGATQVSCTLETGRTHQIRLHALGLGHPVLGDRRYGKAFDKEPPRLALHATRLGFAHPSSGEALLFESPLPDDLAAWMETL